MLDSKLPAPAPILGYHKSGVTELCRTTPAIPYEYTQYHLLYLETPDLVLMWKMHMGTWVLSALSFSFTAINSTTSHKRWVGLDSTQCYADRPALV